MGHYIIKCCSPEHVEEYGKIYAKAFSGEPWNDCWKIEDAILHVSEILESEQSYGWQCSRVYFGQYDAFSLWKSF